MVKTYGFTLDEILPIRFDNGTIKDRLILEARLRLAGGSAAEYEKLTRTRPEFRADHSGPAAAVVVFREDKIYWAMWYRIHRQDDVVLPHKETIVKEAVTRDEAIALLRGQIEKHGANYPWLEIISAEPMHPQPGA